MKKTKITKAVIPAAGLGVRFLPITKVQPKEMLPVYNKPTIQYVVEEAVESGIEDILIVTGRGKRAIEDHFDKSPELELLLRNGKELEQLKEIEDINDLANIIYIRQKETKGLGDAVSYAKSFVGSEPFAVLLGDTITTSTYPCTEQLALTYDGYRSPMVAVEKVPMERIHLYGVIKPRKESWKGIVYEIESFVEKPSRADAPSDYGIIGRYILTPDIFDCIQDVEPDKDGEIQLTDALQKLAGVRTVYGYVFAGKRYDIGNMFDWTKSSIEIALKDPKIRKYLLPFLEEQVNLYKTKT